MTGKITRDLALGAALIAIATALPCSRVSAQVRPVLRSAVMADTQSSMQANAQPASPLPTAPSAVVRPLQLAGVLIPREQPGVMTLTLDQAVALALKNNTELTVRQAQERFVHGQVLTVANALAPNLEFSAYTRAQEINLAAMGFKPGSINIPGFTGTIPTIVKVNTTNAQLSLSQQVFNAPAFFLYRAAGKASLSANWATLSARGGVVLQVGQLYLQGIADIAQVRDAESLVQQDQLVYEHARASRDAGVGINLDVLRAQVELQNEQQQLVRAQNAVAKDKIQLNRVMGQPAGQEIALVDAIPSVAFDADSSDSAIQAALVIAYERRKDLRGLESQLALAEEVEKALKWERAPILGVGGFYGVLGETTGLYHGVFTAEGKLSIPVFQEATLRGQKEVARAQELGLRRQIEARRSQIEGEIRASLLDVQSAAERVKVARSNVTLAGQALQDATMRFTAGVDDNLPVVEAQTALIGAQTQLIRTEFDFNAAKLMLARNTGVVETQYERYLGR